MNPVNLRPGAIPRILIASQGFERLKLHTDLCPCPRSCTILPPMHDSVRREIVSELREKLRLIQHEDSPGSKWILDPSEALEVPIPFADPIRPNTSPWHQWH